MRTEAALFNLPAGFFVVVAFIYGWLAEWSEWVGLVCILLTGGLFFMIGIYLRVLSKRHGQRPEDTTDGEIADHAGEQGVYAPWSWWPLLVALAAALGFTALAVGWWIMIPAGLLAVIALVGWVFEFSRGQHAH
jgi:hypothetical protein